MPIKGTSWSGSEPLVPRVRHSVSFVENAQCLEVPFLSQSTDVVSLEQHGRSTQECKPTGHGLHTRSRTALKRWPARSCGVAQSPLLPIPLYGNFLGNSTDHPESGDANNWTVSCLWHAVHPFLLRILCKCEKALSAHIVEDVDMLHPPDWIRIQICTA